MSLDPWAVFPGSPASGRGPVQLRVVSSLLGPGPSDEDLKSFGLDGLVGAWVVDLTDPACAGAVAAVSARELADAVAAAPGRLPENVLDLVAPAPAPATRRRLQLRETSAGAPPGAVEIGNGDLLLGPPGSTWKLASGGTVQLPTAAQWRALPDSDGTPAICLVDAKRRIAARRSFQTATVIAGATAALAIFCAAMWADMNRMTEALFIAIVSGVLSLVLWVRLFLRWGDASRVEWLRALAGVVVAADVLLILASFLGQLHLDLWIAVLVLCAGIGWHWWRAGRPSLAPWLGTAIGATVLAILTNFFVPPRNLGLNLLLMVLGGGVLSVRHWLEAKRRSPGAAVALSTPGSAATAASMAKPTSDLKPAPAATPMAATAAAQSESWPRRLLIGGIAIVSFSLAVLLRDVIGLSDDGGLGALLLWAATLGLLAWLPLWFMKARRGLWWLAIVGVLFVLLMWSQV